MARSFRAKQPSSGLWRDGKKLSAAQGGQWRDVKQAWGASGGQWRQIWPPSQTPTLSTTSYVEVYYGQNMAFTWSVAYPLVPGTLELQRLIPGGSWATISTVSSQAAGGTINGVVPAGSTAGAWKFRTKFTPTHAPTLIDYSADVNVTVYYRAKQTYPTDPYSTIRVDDEQSSEQDDPIPGAFLYAYGAYSAGASFYFGGTPSFSFYYDEENRIPNATLSWTNVNRYYTYTGNWTTLAYSSGAGSVLLNRQDSYWSHPSLKWNQVISDPYHYVGRGIWPGSPTAGWGYTTLTGVSVTFNYEDGSNVLWTPTTPVTLNLV